MQKIILKLGIKIIEGLMNKQLTQLKNTSCFERSKQQNLKELMRLTLINILNAKGVIYTYYKNKNKGNNAIK